MKFKNLIILTLLGIIFFILFMIFGKKELVFYLNGNKYIEININSKYNDAGFKAKYCNKYIKLFCKDLSNEVKMTKKIDEENNNTYYLNYYIKVNNHNRVLTRTIVEIDKESPTIELFGKNNTVCPNEEYIEEGYKAYDNIDGEITDKVIVEKKLDKIYYNVEDSSGNKKVVFRDIEYKDNEKPTIKLIGKDTAYVFLNQEYVDKGYIVSDNCDNDLNKKIKIESNVDTNKIGEYYIKYIVEDSNLNKSEVIRKVIVYNDYSNIPKNGKTIYLTFDDGPNSNTLEILKVLDKYNVKATFFVTNQFSEYQYIIKEESLKGHSVGVHTLTHKFDVIYSSIEEFDKDFNNMNKIIFEQTGEYAKLFRFPGGSSNTISRFNRGIITDIANKYNSLGYYYFDWNVDSNDTSTTDPNKIFDNVIKGLEDNTMSVVLMHDIKKHNIISVDKIISYGLENGYTFLPIDSNTPLIQHSINN